MLTADEIEQYHDQGYAIAGGFRLSEDELASLLSAVDAVLSDNPQVLPDRLINPHIVTKVTIFASVSSVRRGPGCELANLLLSCATTIVRVKELIQYAAVRAVRRLRRFCPIDNGTARVATIRLRPSLLGHSQLLDENK